ncbi:unnamed protein product [Lymnaea stagnalis]|uniref:Ubiquitin-like domain-containing protein n=1 Tax=Lymnaea stagnalis TaxID=6523 RepID=A0AAV2HWD5_LYMST
MEGSLNKSVEINIIDETLTDENNEIKPADLHRSEGRFDNSEPDMLSLEDQDSYSGHLTPTGEVRSEIGECPVKNRELRMTVSSGNCPTMASEVTVEIQETLKSFVKAVHEKYNDDGTDIADAIKKFVHVPKTGPVKVTASGNIMLPKQVSMSGCEISVAGDPVLIQRMCQKVRELDLMENDIMNWDEVFTILECIPHLTFLNLTKNQLRSHIPDVAGRMLPNLTHLVLNNTLITWDVLVQVLTVFTSLEELHLSLNGFETVDIPVMTSSATFSPPSTPSSGTPSSDTPSSDNPSPTIYPSLHKLFFIGNKVTDWREINKLGSFFPNLVFLLLSETDLTHFDGSDNIGECFPCLQTLGLNRTQLRSWDEVAQLRLFPSLNDVRLNGIPFLDEFTEMFRRQHTIALLPNITNLNGSRIGDSEREDAERAYIRLFLDKEDKPQRYHELVQMHGRVDPLAKVELKPQRFIKLKIRIENANQELIKLEEMSIDVTQTIRDLKKLLSNVAGYPSAKFNLYHLDKEIDMLSDKLKYMDRKLFSYNMRDGDEIIVECMN